MKQQQEPQQQQQQLLQQEGRSTCGRVARKLRVSAAPMDDSSPEQPEVSLQETHGSARPAERSQRVKRSGGEQEEAEKGASNPVARKLRGATPMNKERRSVSQGVKRSAAIQRAIDGKQEEGSC